MSTRYDIQIGTVLHQVQLVFTVARFSGRYFLKSQHTMVSL